MDLAVEHDVGAVGDRERLPHVVIGDQHAESPRTQLRDNALNVIDGDRIHSGKRLVEKHEFRARDQRPGDLEAPPLTAGEGVGLLIAQVGEAELVQ